MGKNRLVILVIIILTLSIYLFVGCGDDNADTLSSKVKDYANQKCEDLSEYIEESDKELLGGGILGCC